MPASSLSVISNWRTQKKTHLFRIRCVVSTIDSSCEPSRQETSSSWEKEDVDVFLEALPRFCLRQLKGLRGNVGEEGRDERESERCKVREEEPRRDGSCWDVWETCPRYANPRLVVRGSTTRGVGALSLQKKEATTFAYRYCIRVPPVDQWHRSYVNRRRAIKDSPRPFLVSVLRSSDLREIHAMRFK